MTSFCMSSELIRNRCSYAGSLWTFTVAARNGNIRAGFGCGDEFLGVWMRSWKFTVAAMGCYFRTPNQAAGTVVDNMALAS